MRSALLALLLVAPCLAEEEAERVFRTCNPSVVGLENLETSGTGIIVSTGGLILTNAHVLSSPLKYRVLVDVAAGPGKTKTVVYTNPKVVGFHPEYDLALLRIDPREHDVTLTPAKILRAKAGTGKRVYAIGNPAISGVTLTKSITDGMLSAVDREMDGLKYYQFSAPINPGNSGGPLLDKDGNVLGLVTFKMTDSDGLGFAVPLHDFNPSRFVPLGKGRGNGKLADDLTKASIKYDDLAKKYAAAKGKDCDEVAACRYIEFLLLRAALMELPDNGMTWFNVGIAWEKAERPDIATAYELRAIELEPWFRLKSSAYQTIGLMLAKNKQGEDAAVVWLEGTAKWPRGTGALWFNAAISDMEAKRWAEAAWHATLAIKSGDANNGDCEHIVADARAKLDAEALKKLEARLAGAEDELKRLEKASADAEKAKKPFLTPAFVKFLKDYNDRNGMPADEKGAGGDETPPAGGDAPPPEPASDPAATAAKWIASKLNMAKSFHKNGMDEKAVPLLEEILEKYPDHPDSKEAKKLLETWKRK